MFNNEEDSKVEDENVLQNGKFENGFIWLFEDCYFWCFWSRVIINILFSIKITDLIFSTSLSNVEPN